MCIPWYHPYFEQSDHNLWTKTSKSPHAIKRHCKIRLPLWDRSGLWCFCCLRLDPNWEVSRICWDTILRKVIQSGSVGKTMLQMWYDPSNWHCSLELEISQTKNDHVASRTPQTTTSTPSQKGCMVTFMGSALNLMWCLYLPVTKTIPMPSKDKSIKRYNLHLSSTLAFAENSSALFHDLKIWNLLNLTGFPEVHLRCYITFSSFWVAVFANCRWLSLSFNLKVPKI